MAQGYEDLHWKILTLIIVILLVGVGVLITDKMSVAVRDSTDLTNTGQNFTGTENLTATMTYGYISKINSVYNDTGITIPLNNVSVTDYYGGNILIRGNFKAQAYNVSYTYLKETAATTSFNAGQVALNTLNNQWLGIIIMILVMSLIIGIIITAFIMPRGRG